METRTLLDYYDNLDPTSDFLADVTYEVNYAQKYLEKKLTDYNRSVPTYKLAIVLDIDDTALSNYPDFVRTHFANDLATQNNRYLAANAPAVIPILNLYQYAYEQNVDVFFITARKTFQDDSPEAIEKIEKCTAKNLVESGYHDYAHLFLAKNEDSKLSTKEFKSKTRQRLEEDGYKIVLNLGDQPSDLEGGYAESTYKIPNQLYPDTLPDTFTSKVSQKSYSRQLPSLVTQGLFKETANESTSSTQQNTCSIADEKLMRHSF